MRLPIWNGRWFFQNAASLREGFMSKTLQQYYQSAHEFEQDMDYLYPLCMDDLGYHFYMIVGSYPARIHDLARTIASGYPPSGKLSGNKAQRIEGIDPKVRLETGRWFPRYQKVLFIWCCVPWQKYSSPKWFITSLLPPSSPFLILLYRSSP